MNASAAAFLDLERFLTYRDSGKMNGKDYEGYFWPILSDFLSNLNK